MHIAAMPQHRAETARVAQAHQHAVVQRQIEVVVFFRRRARGQEAQAAGHAKVQDQRAMLELHQQILAAPPERTDDSSAQQPGQVFRDRPAQPGMAHDRIRDSQPDEMRGQATPRDFYFGQLRHSLNN